ncbi:MAG: hypothetical protein BroJett042_24940 [Bacteroidota bacterium]|nr:MAG: hypothetical protein BroJett042_24940 [Bacteroidota bacterium]
MTRKIAVDIVVFSYILLFVYAALTKVLDYQKFVVQLGQSPILTNYAQVLAVVVPFIELGISLMLIFPKTRLKGLYAAFGLMVMFTTYIVLASRFSDYVPCSCGGVLEGMTWTQHLIFNTVFVLLALIGILLQPNIRSVDSSTSLS